MSNFNWQTEDDVTWDDLEPVAETAVPRRRPWLTYALIVAGRDNGRCPHLSSGQSTY